MMSLPVIGLGAWVATGSERSSYAGIQIVFTFALALLEEFGPTTNLTEIRDRMIGILLGVGLSAVVHAGLWPEAEGEGLRQRLAGLLRMLSEQLRVESAVGSEAGLRSSERYVQGWAELGDCEAVSARVALEPGWQLGEGDHEEFTLRVQTLLAQAREILLAADAFNIELSDLPGRFPAAIRAAALAVQRQTAASLELYARGLTDHPQVATPPPRISLHELTTQCAADAAAHLLPDPQIAAEHRLLARARVLINEVASLPAWGPAPANAGYLSQASPV